MYQKKIKLQIVVIQHFLFLLYTFLEGNWEEMNYPDQIQLTHLFLFAHTHVCVESIFFKGNEKA